MGTRHLYWILTGRGPSFAVHSAQSPYPAEPSLKMHNRKKLFHLFLLAGCPQFMEAIITKSKSVWYWNLNPIHHTVKKVSGSPVPSRDVTDQTLPEREYLN